jgi:hypothetical protein
VSVSCYCLPCSLTTSFLVRAFTGSSLISSCYLGLTHPLHHSPSAVHPLFPSSLGVWAFSTGVWAPLWNFDQRIRHIDRFDVMSAPVPHNKMQNQISEPDVFLDKQDPIGRHHASYLVVYQMTFPITPFQNRQVNSHPLSARLSTYSVPFRKRALTILLFLSSRASSVFFSSPLSHFYRSHNEFITDPLR